jgi:hypothetical protein
MKTTFINNLRKQKKIGYINNIFTLNESVTFFIYKNVDYISRLLIERKISKHIL